jgi:hypothetical protein
MLELFDDMLLLKLVLQPLKIYKVSRAQAGHIPGLLAVDWKLCAQVCGDLRCRIQKRL